MALSKPCVPTGASGGAGTPFDISCQSCGCSAQDSEQQASHLALSRGLGQLCPDLSVGQAAIIPALSPVPSTQPRQGWQLCSDTGDTALLQLPFPGATNCPKPSSSPDSGFGDVELGLV